VRTVLSMLLVLPVCAPALADDYREERLGLRLAPAFIRFLEASAMGGETVANRMSSGINPAAADWYELPGKHGIVLVPYYTNTQFDAGTAIHLYSLAAEWHSGEAGTWQPSVTRLRSNRATTNIGTVFDYDVDAYQLQWAKRLDDFAVGATLNFNNAHVALDSMGLRVADTDAESYRFRGGGLWEFWKNWLAGIIAEYGFAPFRTNGVMPTPGGPVPFAIKDTQYQYILRAGVSFEYADMSTVYVDYQYGAFSDDGGTLESHRFSIGVEHRVLEWLFLRLNIASDVRGNSAFGVGVSIMFAKWGSLHLAYQYDPFPELRFEFGRSQYFMIILAFYF